jgi:hypothetical protein
MKIAQFEPSGSSWGMFVGSCLMVAGGGISQEVAAVYLYISKKEPGCNCLIMPYFALLAQ